MHDHTGEPRFYTDAMPMRRSTAGAGPAVRIFLLSKGVIDSERAVTARIVLKVIAGKAAGERHLQAAELHSDKTAAASGVILLIAKPTPSSPIARFGSARQLSQARLQYSWNAVPYAASTEANQAVERSKQLSGL
jgi:hypothetical protein